MGTPWRSAAQRQPIPSHRASDAADYDHRSTILKARRLVGHALPHSDNPLHIGRFPPALRSPRKQHARAMDLIIVIAEWSGSTVHDFDP